MDRIAEANRKVWESEVEKGCGYSVPWLDLDRNRLEEYAAGGLEDPPSALNGLYPNTILAGIDRKEVLCLASGGGQQSAAFGLLGARVTVADFSAGQLAGDRAAADHYGYDIRTLETDARDLSALDDGTFDLVYQANSMSYIPDCRDVYREVARVLRPGGRYRVDFNQPSVFQSEWRESGYEITLPYRERTYHRPDGGVETRHHFSDIFNGLLELGFTIESVHDWPAYDADRSDQATPGSWTHQEAFVSPEFAIVAGLATR